MKIFNEVWDLVETMENPYDIFTQLDEYYAFEKARETVLDKMEALENEKL